MALTCGRIAQPIRTFSLQVHLLGGSTISVRLMLEGCDDKKIKNKKKTEVMNTLGSWIIKIYAGNVVSSLHNVHCFTKNYSFC